MLWYEKAVKPLNLDVKKQAIARQTVLTKPLGSLGELEKIAIRMASRQGKLKPILDKAQITVFAGDHGIAEEGVSAFPQIVTTEMVKNFIAGGAAISVLAKQWKMAFEVVDVGIANPLKLAGLIQESVGLGTQNFMTKPAMTSEQCQQAMLVGKKVIARAKSKGVELFIGGEMGIANTTSATTLACKVLDEKVANLTGLGTGIDEKTLVKKNTVIEKSLARTSSDLTTIQILENYGGFEIAALTGAYIAAAQQGITILVDGFISSVAVLIAIKIQPEVKNWCEFSHQSSEKGHQNILKAINAKPIVNLNMRLGEASGAAVVLPLIQSACILHNNMATFEEASVSES